MDGVARNAKMLTDPTLDAATKPTTYMGHLAVTCSHNHAPNLPPMIPSFFFIPPLLINLIIVCGIVPLTEGGKGGKKICMFEKSSSTGMRGEEMVHVGLFSMTDAWAV
jgi:hypothetical protein